MNTIYIYLDCADSFKRLRDNYTPFMVYDDRIYHYGYDELYEVIIRTPWDTDMVAKWLVMNELDFTDIVQ